MVTVSRLDRILKRIGVWLRAVSVCVLTCAIAWVLFSVAYRWDPNDVLLAGMAIAMVLVLLGPGKAIAKFRQRSTMLLIGIAIAYLPLELYLRTFDPFPILLRGGRIDLPANVRMEFHTSGVIGLDPTVSITYNSKGFRGPEPPKDWTDYLTILCVGGSTTQCLYLSDGKTWPDRLAERLAKNHDRCWVNNAGIDGHSTFGHLALFDQYVAMMRPKVLLLYVGLNDLDRRDLSSYDSSTLRSQSRSDDSVLRQLHRCVLRNSDAAALLDNLRLQWMARKKGLTHGAMVHHGLSSGAEMKAMSDVERRQWLSERDPSCIAGYRSRLRQIVQHCDEKKIRCVLMTQQVLYGEGIDPDTGIDLERVRVGEVDGWTQWQLLKEYNQATIEIGMESAVPVIDMASQMPKSSAYFYDLTHLNNEGASRFASLVESELSVILRGVK